MNSPFQSLDTKTQLSPCSNPDGFLENIFFNAENETILFQIPEEQENTAPSFTDTLTHLSEDTTSKEIGLSILQKDIPITCITQCIHTLDIIEENPTTTSNPYLPTQPVETPETLDSQHTKTKDISLHQEIKSTPIKKYLPNKPTIIENSETNDSLLINHQEKPLLVPQPKQNNDISLRPKNNPPSDHPLFNTDTSIQQTIIVANTSQFSQQIPENNENLLSENTPPTVHEELPTTTPQTKKMDAYIATDIHPKQPLEKLEPIRQYSIPTHITYTANEKATVLTSQIPYTANKEAILTNNLQEKINSFLESGTLSAEKEATPMSNIHHQENTHLAKQEFISKTLEEPFIAPQKNNSEQPQETAFYSHNTDKPNPTTDHTLRTIIDNTLINRPTQGQFNFNQEQSATHIQQTQVIPVIIQYLEKLGDNKGSWTRLQLNLDNGKKMNMHMRIHNQHINIRFDDTLSEDIQENLSKGWQEITQWASNKGITIDNPYSESSPNKPITRSTKNFSVNTLA